MRGFCPNCAGLFERQMLCPSCGMQLVEETTAFGDSHPPILELEALPDGPSAVHQVLVGTMSATSIYHGLKHLSFGVARASDSVPEISDEKLLLLLGVAVIFSGFLMGVANRRAEVMGLALGLAATGFFFAREFWQDELQSPGLALGIGVGASIAGALGGLLGRLAVAPAPKLPKFGPTVGATKHFEKKKAQPINWIRIIFGTIAGVCVSACSEQIREGIARFFGGYGGYSIAKFIALQISILGCALGGVLAGSSSRAGVRQGAITGAMAAIGVLILFNVGGAESYPVVGFWLEQFDLASANGLVYFTIAATVFASTVTGGWLGATLFPPRPKRRKRLR